LDFPWWYYLDDVTGILLGGFMAELYLFLIFMLIAAIIATEIKDLLAAVISLGAVGFAVAIMFIFVQAPDLAIVQIVVEVLTVVIFVAVILRTTHVDETIGKRLSGTQVFSIVLYALFAVLFFVVMIRTLQALPEFGNATMKVASEYIKLGLPRTGGANLVADVILDFRALDTLGEATVLFTSVIGVVAIMRKVGRKK
jgi:multicomponent Na+:H+ antiporter subunit B